MSNRDALRKLSRKFPAPPEVERIMDSLRDASDLSVAIIATAIVEAKLEELIKQKFSSKNRELMGQIFLNRGPMSDFHSKILIANAFGVVTGPLAEEMQCIKAIRNTFAHAKVPISFDHELIEREVNSLRMLKAMKAQEMSAAHELKLDNKGWFLLITKLLLIVFDGLLRHAGKAQEALADILNPPPDPKGD